MKLSLKKIRFNTRSLLFLYEGDTEGEFYKVVIKKYIPHRKIRIFYSNLMGVYNLNQKVQAKIETYLRSKDHAFLESIYVFIAYDRDGPREKQSLLELEYLKRKYIKKGSKINGIEEIVATRDLESWFFHDIDGIYSYLNVPKKNRKVKPYLNVEKTDNRELSKLFHKHNRHYQKGIKSEGFISSLNIDKIFNQTDELKFAISQIITLCR